MDRCALFVDAGYLLADGAMAVHGTRRRESITWDYEGLLQLLASLARDRTGLPLLRCYWYEATVEGRRSAEHDALADMPGIKLRLAKMRPGRREGVETEIHRDLTVLARNGAVSDAVVVSAEEDLARVVADVQDLGMRVTIVHVTVDGNWTISRSLRQECDDIIELTSAHLRPYADLIPGAESARPDERYPDGDLEALGLPQDPRVLRVRAASNGHSASPVPMQALPAGNGLVGQPGHMAPPPIYTAPVVAEYQRPPQASLPLRDEPGPPSPGAMDDPMGHMGPMGACHGMPAPQVPQGNGGAGGAQPRGREPYAEPVSMPFRGPPAPQPPPAPAGAGRETGDGGHGGPMGRGQEIPARLGASGPLPLRERRGSQGQRAEPAGLPARAAQQGQGTQVPPGQGHPGPPPAAGRQGPADYPGRSRGGPDPAYPAGSAHGDFGPFRAAMPGGPAGHGGGHERPGPPGGREAGPAGTVAQEAAEGRFPPGQLPRRSAAPPPGPPGNSRGGPGAHGMQGPNGAHDPQDVRGMQRAQPYALPQAPAAGPYSGPQPAVAAGGHGGSPSGAPVVSLADAVESAHGEGEEFGGLVARDAPALWLEAVLARKPRMPSDLEARLLQGSALPIDFLLHDEVRHALRRGFWDALERSRR